MQTIPIDPIISPKLLNAKGIANIPVPSDAFHICANDPKILKLKCIYSTLEL